MSTSDESKSDSTKSVNPLSETKISSISDHSEKQKTHKATLTSEKIFPRKINRKRLIWRDIYAEVKPEIPWYKCCFSNNDDGRVVLDGISGVAEAGQITFLMGSSGAGKTTLLNILTQRPRGLRIYGEVQVNSHVLKPGEMRKMSAYVPQEDLFVGALTVEETLILTARLRMPPKTSKEQRIERVASVAREMGLEPIMDTKIGCRYEKSISLGEKKRLSFACEILTDPPILFCDEPTSGLDAFMAVQVMKALCDLAKQGKTIICSIHQPSSQVFEMADWLVLISKGQIAYQGSIKEVQGFFNQCGMPCPLYTSIPDHFMKVLSCSNLGISEENYENRLKAIFTCYNLSDFSKYVHQETHRFETSSSRARMRLEVARSREYAAPWSTQYVWLLWRGVKIVLRNPMIIRLRLFQTVVVALIEGMVYYKTQITPETIITGKGLGFEIVRTMNILFLMPSIQILTSELPVIYRDYQAGIYSPSAYFMGKQTADSIQYILLPLIHTSILYWMAGLDYSVAQYLQLLLMSILEAFVATSIGYAGACIFGELATAALVVPMFSIPMMIFGGLFIDVTSIPSYFQPFTYLSWHRYGYEVGLAAIFEDIGPIPNCLTANDTLNPLCEAPTGSKLLSTWSVDVRFKWINVVALILFVFAWRGLALAALLFRVRKI